MINTNEKNKVNNGIVFQAESSSFKKLLFVSLVSSMPLLVMSQDHNGVPYPGIGGTNPDAGSVPIDGGLSLLLEEGLGYAAK